MTTKFSLIRDINGYNGFGLKPSDLKYSAILAQDTEATLTLPPTKDATYNRWLVIFSFNPGASVFVAYDETAETPAGATFAETTSELNPTGRQVAPGAVLSFITSESAADVQVSLYAIQQQ
jgi:hypothetical protein